MPCYCPLVGYYSADREVSGKRRITFDRNRSLSGIGMKLPCGQCIGCRLEKSRQWAMRCLHEKKMHLFSCFVTLTYNNEHLPVAGTLVKRDLQLFMKKLRKRKGCGIRFYACGEYGDETKRPHYHALLFNCRFDDAKPNGENGRGDKYYVSAELADIWGKGICHIGDVNFDSAAYVARYVMKKITGANAAEAYEVIDGDGVIYRRQPEFTLMSRRPGIASGYYEKYGQEVRDLDNVIINEREVRPPKFYDRRYEVCDPVGLEMTKRKRRRLARLFRADNTSARLRVKEVLAIKLLQQKVRKL